MHRAPAVIPSRARAARRSFTLDGHRRDTLARAVQDETSACTACKPAPWCCIFDMCIGLRGAWIGLLQALPGQQAHGYSFSGRWHVGILMCGAAQAVRARAAGARGCLCSFVFHFRGAPLGADGSEGCEHGAGSRAAAEARAQQSTVGGRGLHPAVRRSRLTRPLCWRAARTHTNAFDPPGAARRVRGAWAQDITPVP